MVTEGQHPFRNLVSGPWQGLLDKPEYSNLAEGNETNFMV